MAKGGRSRAVKVAVRIAGALLGVLILFPLATGRPLLSFPTSASMVPTLDPFDAFLIDPYPGHLAPGDIIVFHSVTTGGPAVHRIVGGSATAGWITKGDANPVEDQAGREPPVTKDRVLGRVVTYPDGSPVRIPKAGIPLTETRLQLVKLESKLGGRADGFAMLLVGMAVLMAIPTFLFRSKHGDPPRAPSRGARALLRRAFPRGVLGKHVGAALLALLVVSIAVAIHSSRNDARLDVIVVGDARAADGERALAPGQSVPRVVDVASLSILPTVAVVEPGSDHLTMAERTAVHIAPWSTTSVDARQTAGTQPGVQSDDVSVWRYPDVLPESWTLALHHAMPGSPYLLLGAIAAGIGAVWLRLLGLGSTSVGPMLGIREDWR